jgi:hypothetical protein
LAGVELPSLHGGGVALGLLKGSPLQLQLPLRFFSLPRLLS